jgi:hypothetical protein
MYVICPRGGGKGYKKNDARADVLYTACAFLDLRPRGLFLIQRAARGGRNKKERVSRENDVHLRQLAKKVRSLRAFFFPLFFLKCVFGRFSARGVRKHEKKSESVSK